MAAAAATPLMAGHADIEQRHIGLVLAVEFQRLLAVARPPPPRSLSGLHVHNGAHAHARHQVVFGY